MSQLRTDIVAGAIAGVAGSLSMMLVRPALERVLLHKHEQQTAEWERIVQVQGRRAGWHPSPNERRVAGAAAHLGYGAGLGALFGTVARRRRVSPVTAGLPYGLLVYAANYSQWGLMPRLGVLPPHGRRARRRAAIPLVHHVVFGLVTAFVYREVQARKFILNLSGRREGSGAAEGQPVHA